MPVLPCFRPFAHGYPRIISGFAALPTRPARINDIALQAAQPFVAESRRYCAHIATSFPALRGLNVLVYLPYSPLLPSALWRAYDATYENRREAIRVVYGRYSSYSALRVAEYRNRFHER